MDLIAIQQAVAAIGRKDAQRYRALANFHSACGNRDNAPVNIAILGDSVTEGMGATQVKRRYSSRLAGALMARMPVTGLTTPGFDTLGANTTPGLNSYTDPHTYIGVNNTDYVFVANYGLPKRGLQVKTTAGGLTFSFTGTRFDIIYTAGSGVGKYNVVIDGGAADVWDGFNAAIINAQVKTYGGLTAGSHTVTIKLDATTTAGRNLYIEDLVTYNGDETKGFHVWNGGHFGFTANSFITGASPSAFIPVTAADLVIIELGLNDVVGKTAAQFQADMTTLIGAVTTGLSTRKPSICLLMAWQKFFSSNGAATWQPFVQAAQSIANARTDTCVLDMSQRWPAATSLSTDAQTFGLYYDNTHPSDRGHALLADTLAGYLSPR